MSKLLVDITPFSITPKQLNESMTKHNGRLIVEGVLQRAESENQNGRIYPSGILKREVDKYKGTSHIIRDIWWEGNDVIEK